MAEARLKTKLWVMAGIRQCRARGLTATIIRKGDEDAGALLIKQNLLGSGFRVLTQCRTLDGILTWTQGTGPDLVEEAAADAYIARQIDRDTDLWVVEVEDRDGLNPYL